MGYWGGLYSGVKYETFPVDHKRDGQSEATFENLMTVCDNRLQAFVTARATDSIVNLTYVPGTYFSTTYNDNGTIKQRRDPYNHDIWIRVPNGIGGYTPRNKKLLCFPYRFLMVDTLDSQQIYKYELFFVKSYEMVGDVRYDTVGFRNTGYISATPSIMSVPNYYDTIDTSVNYARNPSMAIHLKGFPQLAMTVDSFRAYVANGSLLPAAVTLGGQAAMAIGGVATGNPALAVSGALGAAQTVNAAVRDACRADTARGSQNGAPFVADRSYNFYYKKMCIREEYARMIDDYFDRYGYATNRLKVPNIHVRQNWTYTKTQDCTIEGPIPANYLDKIKAVFNKGITFWTNPARVGDYSQANRPLSENP